ncbi:MAG: Sua5/YciO/YrdC/YwlC family protein [Acholeplasmataceae bacterium]
MNKGETLIVQTYEGYMIAADLYDPEGAEVIDEYQKLSNEPICYIYNNPFQIDMISEPIRKALFRWLEHLKHPVYVKLNASSMHEQMSGEKTVIIYFLKTSVHFKTVGHLGIFRAVALPKIKAPTIDETLQILYDTYQHKTQTIYATDEIKPTFETISIVDFTQTPPKIIRQGDATLDPLPQNK